MSSRPRPTDVRENAIKPHLWLVTEGGLVLLFPPYSFGGPYALGGTAEVTIPWAELRTYLNPRRARPDPRARPKLSHWISTVNGRRTLLPGRRLWLRLSAGMRAWRAWGGWNG
ncbi:MAG: RsiV family protein [Terricaulis sp.]